MQTLDQLATKIDQVKAKTDVIDAKTEKRIPIDAAHTPGDASNDFTISLAGSYYLTGNITCSKSVCIDVTVAGATLDLNGFQIAGNGAAMVTGIRVEAAASNCTIKNGSITTFAQSGVGATAAHRGMISHIIASNCLTGLLTGDGWAIESCNAHDNNGSGIQTGAGCTISHCAASTNLGAGYSIAPGSTISDCSALSNQGIAGIYAGSGGCTITHCTARLNTNTGASSAGILAGDGSTVTACTAVSNTNTNNTPTGSTGAGIIAGNNSTVQNCTASFNKGDGIQAGGDSNIIANLCATNGNAGNGAGVHVTGANNRIEGNNVTSNDRGVDVDGAGNLIVRNSASDNSTANYDLAANNVCGLIIDRTAPASAAIVGNSGASSAGTSDPWANFTY